MEVGLRCTCAQCVAAAGDIADLLGLALVGDDRMVTEPAGADGDGGGTRAERRDGLSDRVVGGQADVGECGDGGGIHAGGELEVADDRIADGQVLDRRADGVDPAGVLVAEDEGQVGRNDVGEPAVDDVQVGAAPPSTTYQA